MDIIWPTNTTEVIDAIRGAIGRIVHFYIVASSIECTVCELDPITGTSTNSFCETCSGLYYIPVYSGVSVSGHVTHGPTDELFWTTGGKLYEGEARVQVKYTQDILNTVDSAVYVVIDNKQFEVKNKDLRGTPQLNRILVNLKEREK